MMLSEYYVALARALAHLTESVIWTPVRTPRSLMQRDRGAVDQIWMYLVVNKNLNTVARSFCAYGLLRPHEWCFRGQLAL